MLQPPVTKELVLNTGHGSIVSLDETKHTLDGKR